MEHISSNKQVYLSPHYDDTSLSCGGAIYQQVQAGHSVLVITVCAAPPNPHEPLSSFAKALHKTWGNPKDVVATRQAEDRASMEILGVDYRRLDFTDCIYRGDLKRNKWYYTNEADLFGPIHPADLTLTDRIAEAITKIVSPHPETVLYAPLTVGHHVDHQLTHAAALQFQQQGWPVVFYEDYPYCDPGYPFTRSPAGQNQPYGLEATLATKQAAKLQPQVRPLSESDLQAKLDSIRAYSSQMQMLFNGAAAMEKRVRQYALDVGRGKLAERIWIPNRSS